MKIFDMNGVDYIAAETLEEAKQCLADQIGDGKVTPEFEEDYLENARELTSAEMDNLKLVDEDELNQAITDKAEDKTGDEWKARADKVHEKSPSFRQVLDRKIAAGEKFPQYLASTEC